MNDESNLRGDRNLLFGVLALQAGTITESQLLDAIKQWTFHKDKPLGEILVEQSVLSRQQLDLISPMVDAHLKLHNDDAADALKAISSISDVTLSIRSEVVDDEVQASLCNFDSNTIQTDSVNRPEATQSHLLSRSSSGRFRVLRSHAKGGLGEVFVARDTELNREVALKEIQDRFADVDESRSRFVLEAEITGGLEHPGIVPVYGLGSYDDGRPYYAMRFIKGDSLKESIHRFHRSELHDSQRSLELRKLLGRFIDVCQAIGYAHARGVLHRDLKPGNIMLGNYGETLVVDWGLAKIIGQKEQRDTDFNVSMLHVGSNDSVSRTLMGSAIGTPSFMPPEQAAGLTDQLGPHSDIYSLGATLYYLLTGKPPFDGKNSVSILEQVKSGDFTDPKTVNPSIPRELNAICMQAMATEARDRYPSTVALADDIERFLADEGVSALAEPVFVRVRRWLRKHPTITSTTAAAVLISTLALVVFSAIVSGKNTELAKLNTALDGKTVALEKTNATLDQKNQALQKSVASEQAAKRLAQENKKKADENYQLARQSVDKYFTQISENRLLNEPYMDDLRNELLASASEFYSAIVERRQDDPAALMDLGTAQVNLGRLSWELGDADKAIREMESARDLIQEAAKASEPSQETKLKQLWNSRLLSQYYDHVGRHEESISLLNDAIAASGEILNSNPQSARVANMHVRLLSSRGGYLFRQDQWEAAIKDYKRVASTLERINKTNHGDDTRFESANTRALAKAYTDLGTIKFRQQEYEECKEWHRKALDLRRQLTEQGDDSISAKSGLSSSISMMAQYYRRMNELDKALSMAEEATEIAATLAEEHPELASLKHEYLISLSNLGLVHQVQGNLDKADELNDHAGEVLEGMIRKHPAVLRYRYLLGTTQGNRGNTSLRRKEFRDAIEFYDRSNKTMSALLERSPNDARARIVMRNNHWGRADAFDGLKQFPQAIAAFDETLKFATGHNAAELRMARAMAIARSGDYDRAIDEVDAEMKRPNTQAMIRYDGARVLMLAIKALEVDKALDKTNRDAKTESAKKRAVELLRQAFEDGYLKKDDKNSPLESDEFEPLAQIEEFKRLLKDAGLIENR